MMNALMIATMLASASASATQTQTAEGFGYAAGNEHGACIGSDRRLTRFPQSVQIVVPGPGMQPNVIRAQVVAELAEPCEAIMRTTIDPEERPKRYYAVRVDKAYDESLWRGIANFARVPAGSLRSCASSEGLHFTAWKGRPLHSQRLWHAYVSLDYDNESSNCQPREYEP